MSQLKSQLNAVCTINSILTSSAVGRSTCTDAPYGRWESRGRWAGTAIGYGAAALIGWKAAATIATGTALLTVGSLSISPFIGCMAIAGVVAGVAVMASKKVPSRDKSVHDGTAIAALPFVAWPLTATAGIIGMFGVAQKIRELIDPSFIKQEVLTTPQMLFGAGVVALSTLPLSSSSIFGSIGHAIDQMVPKRKPTLSSMKPETLTK